MNSLRCKTVSAMVVALFISGAIPFALAERSPGRPSTSSDAAQGRSPQPVPSPNAPNQNFPQGMNGPGPRQEDPKVVDKQRQVEVKADVEKLYQLVTELREQIQKTDTSETLSISVVKKAQQIEKLAKQVKDRAKG